MDQTSPSLQQITRFRSDVTFAIRRWFHDRAFTEVETPSLVRSPGMEVHLHAFGIESRFSELADGRRLHTSPEFAIKTAFGDLESDVFTLARAYRDEATSRWHHPEFTMLEWYRRDAEHDVLMRDCEELIHSLIRQLRGNEEHKPTFAKISVAAAFKRFANVDVFTGDLGRAVQELGLDADPSWDRGTLFAFLQALVIEPALARIGPAFLTDFPADQAALARVSKSDPRVAERFELYLPIELRDGSLHGIELANAFGELTDPTEQRRRFEADLQKRSVEGGVPYPLPERMLSSLSRMPQTAGIALGVERLLVWLSWYCFGWQLSVKDFLLGEP